MTEFSSHTERVNVALVAFSFALSGMAIGLTTSVALKSHGQNPVLIGVLVVVIIFLSHALAARSLRVKILACLGIGFATGIGTIASLPPFIATQAMKGNETFGELFVQLAAWYAIAFLFASVIGLSTLHKSGWRVFAQGVLGYCVGAVANGALMAQAFRILISGNDAGWLLMVSFFCLPGMTGGIALAWALNSRLRTQTRRETEDAVKCEDEPNITL